MIDGGERIDRMFQFLWAPWVDGASWVALAGRGLVLVLALAAVSLSGFCFSFFKLALGIVVRTPTPNGALKWETRNHRQEPVEDGMGIHNAYYLN